MLEWFDAGAAARAHGRAVFVDRDGVLNRHIGGGYVLSLGDFEWLPGALEEMRRLTGAGHAIFVASNQSCVERGLLSVEDLRRIMDVMVDQLVAAGVNLLGWACCPHRPEQGCDCRKPRPGMLQRAGDVLELDLQRCVFIGDSASDVECGRAVGMSTFRLRVNCPEDLHAAVDSILLGEPDAQARESCAR